MFTAKTLIDDKVAGFEAGADDYLTKPTHPAELASRVKAILARNVSQKPQGAVRGAAVGVIGAKGGVGTTTLAVNIAAARLLAGDTPIIADFRLGMGSMGLSIGLGRSHGMANVLAKPADEIRPRAIDNDLITHPSGLRALVSSVKASESQLIFTPEAGVAVVRSLRSMGRPAVFDLGSGLTPLNMRLLREMDQIVLVVDPVIITLAIARDMIQEIMSGRNDPNRLHVVVVNRATSSAPPSWNDVEQYIGYELRGIISLASDLVLQALQANVPAVMFQPNAVVSTQLIKLAEDLHSRVRLPAGEQS